MIQGDEEDNSTQLSKSKSETIQDVPDAETKLAVGDKPKLIEIMSIAELPLEVKKKYQIHVDTLKSIRGFMIDAYSNFT